MSDTGPSASSLGLAEKLEWLARPGATTLVVSGLITVFAPLILTVYVSFFDDKVIVFPPQGYSLAWYGSSIPQFISPNGDGDNDAWVIENLQYYPNNKLKIFNRWGNEVYAADPYNNDWVGTPNISYSLGSGVLPTGTYYYVIDLHGDGSQIISDYIEIQK